VESNDYLSISAGTAMVLFALGFAIKQFGHQAPGIIDALRRWTAAVLEWARARRKTAETVEGFRRDLFARLEKAEAKIEDYRSRIEVLEDLIATQAQTIASLREQLDEYKRQIEEKDRQLAALNAEREELVASIGGGSKARGKAMPEVITPERGTDDTGSHRIPPVKP
jgi:uncharacterized coiled-coil protein SlyX